MVKPSFTPTVLVLGMLLAPMAGAASEQLLSCDMGKRNPEAPDELDQFAFIVGNWNIKARPMMPDGKWSDQHQSAYWEGRWILDGRAIMDAWYDAPPTADREDGGDAPGRGVNVRMYRPETGQWTNMWQHSGLAEVRTLMSEVRDDGLMHLWASHPDTTSVRRMHFVVESPDFWYRLEERSRDGGKTWHPVVRLDAHRAPCPWPGPPSD